MTMTQHTESKELSYLNRLIAKGELLAHSTEMDSSDRYRAWFASIERFKQMTAAEHRVAWLEFEDELEAQGAAQNLSSSKKITTVCELLRQFLVPELALSKSPNVQAADESHGTSTQESLVTTAIEAISFSDEESVRIAEIMTGQRSMQKMSGAYLERVVQNKLGGYLEEALGVLSAQLSSAFDWSPHDIILDGASLKFPNGSYAVTFRADDTKFGILVHTVRFEVQKTFELQEIRQILGALGRQPASMSVELKKRIDPTQLIQNLKKSPWIVTSQLPLKVSARHPGGSILQILPDIFTFSAFSEIELWGEPNRAGDVSLIEGVLQSLSR